MKKKLNLKVAILSLFVSVFLLVSGNPVKNEKEAISLVRSSIIKHDLAEVKCVLFYAEDNGSEYEVDVRSDNSKCGGDSDIEPSLFRYTVNKSTGELMTDSFSYSESMGYDWDGSFYPID